MAVTLLSGCGTPSGAATARTTAAAAFVPPSSDGQDVFPLGQVARLTGVWTHDDGADEAFTLALSVESVASVARPAVAGRSPARRVALLVRAASVSGSCFVNPYDFVVRSARGEEYEHLGDATLPAAAVRQGHEVRGYLSYDLPRGPYVVEHRSGLVDEVARWRFFVG